MIFLWHFFDLSLQEVFEKGDEGELFDHITSTGSGYDLRQRPEGQVKVRAKFFLQNVFLFLLNISFPNQITEQNF